MSTLYTVSVREIENDTTVVLDVQVVHPDSMYISPTPGFALMLLWEGADGDAPLSTELDLDTVLDEGWMRKYAKGFVADVEQIEVDNEPPPAAQQDYEHDYWKEPHEWLRGTLRIRGTDPAWIAHLSEGQGWDSTAYESNSAFDDCEPIPFEEAAEPVPPSADQDPHAGLIPVPRVFFLDYLSEADDEFIWFPKYSDKAYVPDEVFEGEAVTAELLDSMVGEVVWYDNYGEGVGVLMPDHQVVYVSPTGSRGSTGMRPGGGPIARARFNTNKKRLADPVTIPGLARAAHPVVVDAVIDGPSVTLTLHCFDPRRELALQNAANDLALISAPECDTFDGFAEATSKLGTFLRDHAAERDISFANQIFPQLAGGIIVESTVAKTKDAEPIDWDALEGDELLAVLREDPWDTWTIRVVTSDPAWVEHLPEMTPFAYGFSWVEEPEPWDGERLTYG